MRQAALRVPPLPELFVAAVLQFVQAVSRGGPRLPSGSRRWYPRGVALEGSRSQSSQTSPPIDPSVTRVSPIAGLPKNFLAGYRPVRSRSPNLQAGRYSWPRQAQPATIHLDRGFSQAQTAGLTRAVADL